MAKAHSSGYSSISAGHIRATNVSSYSQAPRLEVIPHVVQNLVAESFDGPLIKYLEVLVLVPCDASKGGVRFMQNVYLV